MSAISLLNVTTYADGHDFTSDTNTAKLEMTITELDRTTFASNGWKECVAGVKSVRFSEEGIWQAGSAQVDPEVFPNMGATKTFTLAPVATETGTAYIWQAKEVHYELPRGGYGELAQFLINSVGANGQGVVKGKLALKKTTVSSTGSKGTACNIATTSASAYVYASLHCFTAGTSASVRVESATESGFASATTVATFPAVTAAGGNWLTRVAATSGQNYYRFYVSGISGSFDLAGAIAVQ